MLRSFAAVDFFSQGRFEIAGILPYFKIENFFCGKKDQGKTGFLTMERRPNGRFSAVFDIGKPIRGNRLEFLPRLQDGGRELGVQNSAGVALRFEAKGLAGF